MLPTAILRAFAVIATAGVLSINAPAQCVINMGSTSQTIDGFGFSTAWCPGISSAQGSLLFGTGGGQLGFTILRCRIDPGGSGNWGTEQANASVAHSYGAKVMGTPWSPPASMKNNGSVICGDLLASQYGAFASYLNQAANSIGLDYVSMQNEPDFCPGNYESCNPTASEIETFCANNAPAIGRPVIVAESDGFYDNMTDPTLNNSTAASHITIVAGHFYGNGNYVHQNALNHGKHVWETEINWTGANIGTAMTEAQSISDAMNNQFSAFLWWWIMPNDPASFLNGTSVDIRGYVLGQFAHWIRPGSARVSSTYNPQSGVSVTAYKVNGNLVIVALNTGTGSVNQQFNIQNGSVGSLEGYRTSSSQNMADIGSSGVSGGSFTATLSAQSVTTFVQTSGGGGGGIANGTYKLVNLNSGLALDATGAQTTNGTQLEQWTYHSGNNQQWTITSLGSSLYQIIGVQSGKSVDISNWGTTNGTKVQLWTYDGGSNQKYYFNATSGGYYEISPSHATGSCLDVSGVSKSPGAIVWLWQWLSGANQQWSPQAP